MITVQLCLNSRGDVRKLHDKCPNPKCKGEKQITFTPKQVQLEGVAFQNKVQKDP